MHFFIRFEPAPDRAAAFREELLRVIGPSKAEPGCRSMRVFESLRGPVTFAIHSEWADEAAFNLHARMPHTVRFIEAAERLLERPIEGLRARELGPPEP